MTYEIFDPPTAHRHQQEGWAYVDVRSPPEFAQGHPEGAMNVPVLLAAPSGMVPNAAFVATIQRLYPTDAPLLLGCRSGQRSEHACNLLAAAGYTRLANVDRGFLGPGGWVSSGLPTSNTGRTWADITAAEGGR